MTPAELLVGAPDGFVEANRRALEAARAMPNGPEKTEALKRAGLLRKAADAAGISFAKRGRPRK